MSLEPHHQVVLANLELKARGQDVGWINIAAARALTAAGLAERNRQGWRITPAGTAALIAASPSTTILAFRN